MSQRDEILKTPKNSALALLALTAIGSVIYNSVTGLYVHFTADELADYEISSRHLVWAILSGVSVPVIASFADRKKVN